MIDEEWAGGTFAVGEEVAVVAGLLLGAEAVVYHRDLSALGRALGKACYSAAVLGAVVAVAAII